MTGVDFDGPWDFGSAEQNYSAPHHKENSDTCEPHKPIRHVADYPFIRMTWTAPGEDGWEDIASWKPGVDYETDRHHRDRAACDGWGQIILTEVATFKPGRYPERIFYTRRWRAPDGKEFGKPELRVATVKKFKRLCDGWRCDEDGVLVREPTPPNPPPPLPYAVPTHKTNRRS